MASFSRIVGVVLVGLSVVVCQAQVPDSAAVLRQARADIAALCHDSTAGRGYVQGGHVRAAGYIAGRFRQAGLRPANNSSASETHYYQPIIFKTNVLSECALSIEPGPHTEDNRLFRNWWRSHGELRRARTGEDVQPAGYSGSGKLNGTAVYIGHGTPEELKGLEVRGRVVILQEGLPANYTPDASLHRHSIEALKPELYRVRLALQQGALGAVILRKKLTLVPAPMQLPAPVLELRTTSAAWLVANGAVTEATGGGTPPTEVALGSTYPISLRVKAELQDVQSQNVVAVLQGTDTAAPALVVCGHYDHLGRVQGEGPDDAVYSGANDNASGVAFVLSLSDELARRAAAGQRLRNTVVFIAFSGEECGLHGSACYTEPTCALPPVPLGRTKLVLNFDLLGYGEEGAMVVGASTFTALADELWALNDGIGKPIALSRRPNAANSDHWPFTERGIPGLFFYLMGGKTHYHDVHDRPEELSLAGFWALRRLMLLFVAQQS